MTHKWKGIDFSQFGKEPEHTGFDVDQLRDFGNKSVELPDDFNVHPRLHKMHISNRLKSIAENKVDWATAEAIALTSLNFDGYNTRIVGEDVERGTFS